MNRLLIALVLGASAVASSASSGHAPRYSASTERVRFDDLDLSSPADARRMLQRMRAAAGDACYQPRSDTFPWAAFEMARCRQQTLARAVKALDAPLVTAAYGPEPARDLAAR
jgi:UrcA family protein